MVRHEIGQTFSDTWYRIAPTRPRLSPHAQVVRQHYGPEVSYVVEEPAGGGYYRISEAAYFFIGLLDGTRTVGEAWDACNAQLGDAAPTQRQCVEVLGRLQLYGLLLGEQPLAPDMVLERKVQARKRRLDKRTGKWFFFTVPLVNPEAWLERHAAVCRLAFSRLSFVLWLLVVGVGLGMVIANWERFGSRMNFAALLDPGNLVWLGVVFMLLRGIHELGHAAACKAFGGRVTEIGVILIALVLPLPYCDASSAWRFPRMRHRVLVSLGGVLVESFIAGAAAVVWAFTEPGLLNTVCYNVMIVSGVSTFIFNLNPLLRYDGYYILSDIAGSANLAQRSKELWKYSLHRWAFGVKNMRPPAIRDGAEAALLWVYGVLSTPYRLLILLAIVLVLLDYAPTIGVILAAVMVAMTFVWPVLKAVGHLASSPTLSGRRVRAVTVSAGAVGGLIAFLGLVPMPAAAYAPGVVGPAVARAVRAGEGGFVRAVRAATNDTVREGEVLFELDSPEMRAMVAVASSDVAHKRAILAKTLAGVPGERELAARDLEASESERRRYEERVAALRVAAPATGRLISAGWQEPELENLLGRYVKRGDLIASVMSIDDRVVRVMVSDKEYSRLARAGIIGGGGEVPGGRVEIKVHGLADRTIPARVARAVEAGTRDLTELALATPAGGNIMIDPGDSKQQKTLLPHFVLELRADGADLPESAQPGLRAQVRFAMPPEPLLSQWGRRLMNYVRRRLG